MFKLILSFLAIFLAVRLIQQKFEEKQRAMQEEKKNGRIIEGEVVNEEHDSNKGE